MKSWTLSIGTSAGLLAAALVDWITERSLIPALLIAAAGALGFTLTILFLKKSATSSPPSVAQNNKQESKPDSERSPPCDISVENSYVPTPALEPEPAPRCNIHFKDARLGAKKVDAEAVPPARPRRESYLAALFENQAIEGAELRTPAVFARAIYRNSSGRDILSVTNVSWAIGTGQAFTTLEANTPNFLVLFILTVDGKLICRTIANIAARMADSSRKIPQWQDYEFREPIASVEVQLLTDTECLYPVLLEFQHQGMNTLPQLSGFREL